jgi:DNA ligase-1
MSQLPSDPTGYWMSDKLDGVRAYWDGKRLISRQGNVFAAPEWFTKCLPEVALDGELWAGPGSFNLTSGIVRRARAHDGWKKLAYYAFDAPAHPGQYEQRQEFLEQVVKRAKCTHLKKTQVEKIRSRAHLDERLEQGGAVVLVRPGSPYSPQRTDLIIRAEGIGVKSRRRPSRSQKRRRRLRKRLTSRS